MKRVLGAGCVMMSAVLLMGAANGGWLERVSPADHARLNPLNNAAESEKAAAAGAHLFHQECSKCHGEDGLGRNGRPPVMSDRIAHTTDGDLFWLMNNGVPWHGMPPWIELPTKERWQLVTYLRALNGGASGASKSSETKPGTPQ